MKTTIPEQPNLKGAENHRTTQPINIAEPAIAKEVEPETPAPEA